jgi:hypothetical protein
MAPVTPRGSPKGRNRRRIRKYAPANENTTSGEQAASHVILNLAYFAKSAGNLRPQPR